MGSYNNLRLYQKCYNLSIRQYYSLKSAKYINDNVLDLTIYNLVVSCIGIHKYEEAYYYADFLDGTFKNLLLYLLCEHLNNIEDNNNYTFDNGNDVKIIEDFKNCLKSKNFNKLKEINLQLYELLIYLNED